MQRYRVYYRKKINKFCGKTQATDAILPERTPGLNNVSVDNAYFMQALELFHGYTDSACTEVIKMYKTVERRTTM